MSSVVDGLLLESAAMKRYIVLVFLIVLGGFVFAEEPVKFEPLPVPLTNNAVASIKSRGALYLYSFMGMGAKKTWDATSNAAYVLDPETGKWAAAHPVPGTVGRLAASAIGAREHVFLFGGYVVDAQGGETTLSDVNVYEPLTDRWFRAEDMLTPVDDAVVGVYRDRYIYVVGGWSKTDAVHDVQLYDAQKNKWSQATPIPGTPVFGHAGAVVGDTIVYIDGAQRIRREVNPSTSLRTSAGWERSTTTISPRFSGPNCPTILERRATGSRREPRKKTRRFIFRAVPTIHTTTTASDTTARRRSRPR